MGLAYEFDWSVLWREPFGMMLLKGLGLTIFIGLTAWIIALSLGIILGTMRVMPSRSLRFVSTLYVEVFRNIPLIVQLFFWFFAGPMIFGETMARQINQVSSLNFYVAIIGLGLYTASRIAEHVRAGYTSIGLDQYHAVLSTGMTQVQMYRYVIIPYALRLTIPPLTTEFLTIFKNSPPLNHDVCGQFPFADYSRGPVRNLRVGVDDHPKMVLVILGWGVLDNFAETVQGCFWSHAP